MCGVYCEHTWRAQQVIHQYVVKGSGDVLGMSLMGEHLGLNIRSGLCSEV